MWNKDEIRGKAGQVKGRIKQKAGDLRKNERLRDEGVADETAGKIQEGFGKSRRVVGNAIKDIGNQIKK